MAKSNFIFGARANTFLRASLFSGIGLFIAASAFAQSERRPSMGRIAPSPSLKHYLANLPEVDVDLYVGKIVRKDGDYVIVNVMSPSSVPNRQPVYYACDVKMRPTSILEYAGISHRSCATFKTASGTAITGDTVMVKYAAPKKEEKQQ